MIPSAAGLPDADRPQRAATRRRMTRDWRAARVAPTERAAPRSPAARPFLGLPRHPSPCTRAHNTGGLHMLYGLYLSATGVVSSSYKQDVVSNNLANSESVGFKRDIASFRQRLTEAQERGRPGLS